MSDNIQNKKESKEYRGCFFPCGVESSAELFELSILVLIYELGNAGRDL